MGSFDTKPFVRARCRSRCSGRRFCRRTTCHFRRRLCAELLIALSRLALPPLSFSERFLTVGDSITSYLTTRSGTPTRMLRRVPTLLRDVSGMYRSTSLLCRGVRRVGGRAISTSFPVISKLSSGLLRVFQGVRSCFIHLS